MPEIVVERLGELSIMGLMVREILQKAFDGSGEGAAYRGPAMTVVFTTAGMSVTVHLSEKEIRIEDGAVVEPAVTVQGEMNAFLKVATGSSPIGSVLTRKIRVTGDPRKLPVLMKLFAGSVRSGQG